MLDLLGQQAAAALDVRPIATRDPEIGAHHLPDERDAHQVLRPLQREVAADAVVDLQVEHPREPVQRHHGHACHPNRGTPRLPHAVPFPGERSVLVSRFE